MPDERMESIERGIAPPPESPAAADAARRRTEALRRQPADAPLPEGAMGGTSDAETAGDEARMNAAIGRGLEGEEGAPAPASRQADGANSGARST
jgi:hypothetical protein